MDGVDLAKQFVGFDQAKRRLKDELANVERQIREVKTELLAQFEKQGVQSIRVDGMTVHLSRRFSAKVKGDKTLLIAAVEDYAPELVKPGLNMNSLSALMREKYEGGNYKDVQELQESLPPDMAANMDVNLWFDVLVRQS